MSLFIRSNTKLLSNVGARSFATARPTTTSSTSRPAVPPPSIPRKQDVPVAPQSPPKFKLHEKKQASSNIDPPEQQQLQMAKEERVPVSKEDGALASDASATPSAFDAVKSVATSAFDMARSAAATVVDAVKQVSGVEPPNDREKSPYGKSMNPRDAESLTRDAKASQKGASSSTSQWEGASSGSSSNTERKRNPSDSSSFEQSGANKMRRDSSSAANEQWSTRQQQDSMNVRHTGNDTHQHARSYEAKPVAGRVSDGVEQNKSFASTSASAMGSSPSSMRNKLQKESTLERDLATAATEGESLDAQRSLRDSNWSATNRDKSVIDSAKEVAQDVKSAVSEKMTDAKEWISDKLEATDSSTAVGSAKVAAKDLKSSVSDKIEDAKEWVGDKVDKGKASIKSGVNSAADSVKDAANPGSETGRKVRDAADKVKDKTNKNL